VLTCDRLEGRTAPHLLIGGYGMGFTLRAALAKLDSRAKITVAELVPEIIEWARGPMAELAESCLDDPRVQLTLKDVSALIEAETDAYDAILLDVDNGPDGLTRKGNDRLYSLRGLSNARKSLKIGGVLAIWSAGPDAPFTRRLKETGFVVEEIAIAARSNGKGPRHVIWFATKIS
jgi:spermidine synthase